MLISFGSYENLGIRADFPIAGFMNGGNCRDGVPSLVPLDMQLSSGHLGSKPGVFYITNVFLMQLQVMVGHCTAYFPVYPGSDTSGEVFS